MLFLFVVFLVIYCCALAVRNNPDYQLKPRAAVIIKRVHYIAMFLCITSFILFAFFDLRFYGVWTSPVFVITAFTTGVFYALVSGKRYANKADKIYFYMFSRLPFLSLLFFAFPFEFVAILGAILTSMLPVGTIYQDSNLVVLTKYRGIMAMPAVEVLSREGIFNKNIPLEDSYSEKDSVRVKYDGSNAKIYFYMKDEEDKINVADSVIVKVD